VRYYALGLFIHSGMFFPGILISTRFLLNTDAYQLYQRRCLSLCSHPIPICIIITRPMLVWISFVPYMYFLSLSTVIVSCSFFVAIITHLIMSSPNIVIITAMMLRPSLSIFPQLQTASPFLVVVVLPRSVPSPTVFIFMVFFFVFDSLPSRALQHQSFRVPCSSSTVSTSSYRSTYLSFFSFPFLFDSHSLIHIVITHAIYTLVIFPAVSFGCSRFSLQLCIHPFVHPIQLSHCTLHVLYYLTHPVVHNLPIIVAVVNNVMHGTDPPPSPPQVG